MNNVHYRYNWDMHPEYADTWRKVVARYSDRFRVHRLALVLFHLEITMRERFSLRTFRLC